MKNSNHIYPLRVLNVLFACMSIAWGRVGVKELSLEDEAEYNAHLDRHLSLELARPIVDHKSTSSLATSKTPTTDEADADANRAPGPMDDKGAKHTAKLKKINPEGSTLNVASSGGDGGEGGINVRSSV
jgi:hypothetical protein